MRIGIPKALVYYYYFPLWKTLFEEIGAEVVVSDDTSKSMIDEGIKVTVQEICVPIKVFNGHVMDLINKGVDYIFIPRLVSIKKYETFCPKFLGLPDMAKNIFKEQSDKILSPIVSCNADKITNYSSYKEVAEKLDIPKWKMKSALRTAGRKWSEFRKLSMKGYSINDILSGKLQSKPSDVNPSKEMINIGLMGYVYNVYDNFISMDIVEKFRSMGVNIITFDMLPEKHLLQELKHLKKHLFWTFSNKILGAGFYFLNNQNIDGIIHITAFGCGPDSYIGKMMELESDKKHKPFLTIRVDEHTGESHLVTRIEAFTDMLKRRKIASEGRMSV
ncbi:MAG: acyl-CoA dehydratase activase-related protein [Clostridia bacterium]|nr:acyl-CoA dehydratase activase-related protein [Clostridia bacterium]